MGVLKLEFSERKTGPCRGAGRLSGVFWLGALFLSGCSPKILGIERLVAGASSSSGSFHLTQVTAYTSVASPVTVTNIIDVKAFSDRMYVVGNTAAGYRKLFVTYNGTDFELASNINAGSDGIGTMIDVDSVLYFTGGVGSATGLFRHAAGDPAVTAGNNMVETPESPYAYTVDSEPVRVGNDLFLGIRLNSIGYPTNIYRVAPGATRVTLADAVTNFTNGQYKYTLYAGTNTLFIFAKWFSTENLFHYTVGDPIVTPADGKFSGAGAPQMANFVTVGNTLYFSAQDTEYWLLKYDAGDAPFNLNAVPNANTMSTRALNVTYTADAVEGIAGFGRLTAVGNTLLFSAIAAGEETSLYRYTPGDPLVGKSQKVLDGIVEPRSLLVRGPTSLYFEAREPYSTSTTELFTYTIGGARVTPADALTDLNGFNSGYVPPLGMVGTTLYFQGPTPNFRLFKYDPGDPPIVAADAVSNIRAGGDSISKHVVFKGELYLVAQISGGMDYRLFKFNPGSVLVSSDHFTFPVSLRTAGTISSPLTAGGWLYFIGGANAKLYRTRSGVAALTAAQALTNVNPSGSDAISELTAMRDGSVVFSATDPSGHIHLYRYSDSGLAKISNTSSGGDDGVSGLIELMDGSLYFSAKNTAGYYKGYRYVPGGPVVTASLSDTNASGDDYPSVWGSSANGSIFFQSMDDGGFYKIYRYTSGGAVVRTGDEILNLIPGGHEMTSQYAQSPDGNTLLVAAADSNYFDKLYRCDIASPGCVPISDINVGDGDYLGGIQFVGNQSVYFVATDLSTCGDYRLFHYVLGSGTATIANVVSNTEGSGCDGIYDFIATPNEVFFTSVGQYYRHAPGAPVVTSADVIVDPGGAGTGTVLYSYYFENALYLIGADGTGQHIYRYVTGDSQVTTPYLTFLPSGENAQYFHGEAAGRLYFTQYGGHYYRIDPVSAQAFKWDRGAPGLWAKVGAQYFQTDFKRVFTNPDSPSERKALVLAGGAANRNVRNIFESNGALYIVSDPCGGGSYSCQVMERYGP